MEINTLVEQFLAISIVGVALSVGIQWLQSKFGAEGNTTRAIAVVGSVVLGGVVWYLVQTPMWASIVGVLGAASTMYAMFFSGIRKN